MRIMPLILLSFFCQWGLAGERITFKHACTPASKITVAAVGDILLHMPLQVIGEKNGFETLWATALPFFKKADLVYANLEGPIDPHPGEKASYPAFGYSPKLAHSLKISYFTLVSTANNHALDQSASGVDKTILTLDNAKVGHIGTRFRGSKEWGVYITTKNNIKIAWIACTEHTNGIIDNYDQVLYCYKKNDREWIMKTIQHLKSKVDAIIVTPHWGTEYSDHPNSTQIQFAHEVLDQGATAVIGSHPHVLQPLKKYITQDGREAFIMYSLGNFVSYQGSVEKRSTVILLFGLSKTTHGTFINGVRFVPMYMQNRAGLKNMTLMRIDNDHSPSLPYQIIYHVMPIENILYTTDIVTNPGCR